jgi:Holliday junction resolvasome RuvABC endonuclease subunit
MKELRVLGVDPGLDMGWSLNVQGKPIDYGTLKFGQLTPEQLEEDSTKCWRMGYRAEVLEVRLLKIVECTRPTMIAVEQVPLTMFKTPTAAEGYVLVLVAVNKLAAYLQIPIVMLNTSAVKKHATGSGKAKKADMIRNVMTHWKIPLLQSQDDIADAMWIADMGEKQCLNSPT